MKRFLVTTTILISLAGCNFNENKEARIQKLETQMKRNSAQLQDLEKRIEVLELNTNADER